MVIYIHGAVLDFVLPHHLARIASGAKATIMTDATLSAEALRGDYGRPETIEERSNRFLIHPLSEIVVKAALRVGASANLVSLLGLASGWLAAWFYFYQPDRLFVLAGFLAMVAWHVFDGADGRVARATGTSSAFGRVLDGICDHLVFAAVYISLTLSMVSAGAPIAIWFIIIGAGASHAVQAAAYEERRQRYQRRSSGINRSAANEKLLEVDGKKSLFALGYDRVQKFVAGDASALDEALEKLRGRRTSNDAVQAIVNKTAALVRRWSLLNANNRTLMIALAAFIGQPILYFIYELVILNAVLAALLVYEQRAEREIARKMAAGPDHTG